MSRRQSTRLSPITDVQLTSFMDLTFLLLIVFIVTAPGLEYGIDVSPPKMNSAPIEDKKSVVITLNDHGQIVFEKNPVTMGELARKLSLLGETQPDLMVLIRAGQNRPYGEVIGILRVVRGARIKNVSLITVAEDV